jgi:hypothetical protein
MKTKKILYILLIMSLILSACREINVKTIVNGDGSFKRVITLRGDSSDVVTLNLPYPVDEGWTRECYPDTTEDVFVCVLSKTYKNDRLLQEELEKDTSWRNQIERDIEISKRFMFFYSFVTYKETYRAANPVKHHDYHPYLNQEQLDLLSGRKIPLTKADSAILSTAEAFSEKYFLDALTLEVIESLEKGIEKSGNPVLEKVELEQYRDSIASRIAEYTDEDFEQYFEDLVTWTGETAFEQLAYIDPPIFENLDNKIRLFENLLMAEEYSVEVEMPGLITATNSTEMIGNTVSWNVQNMSFFFEDYEMTVESRVINNWAFWLSGVVLFILLIAMIVRIFR